MARARYSSSNASVSADDKASLNAEYQALALEIERNSDKTEFNGTAVIGTSGSLVFQIGFKAGDTISVATADLMNASGISAVTGGDILSAGTASAAMGNIDTALNAVASLRADFGAAQNRLESVVRNNANIIENQSAARSRVMDADFAKETANLTRSQILQQAGVAMLAQANALPQNVLSLLR